jgi:hypothetical protein
MRRPADTFGVLSCFSLNLGPLGFGLVLGAGIEDAFDGKEKFCEVAGRPAGETRNKAFNHEKSFTF